MTQNARDFSWKQIKRLWDWKFGSDHRETTFDTYQRGIPPIPKALLVRDSDLPFLSLADPRPCLPRICRRVGVNFQCSDLQYLQEPVFAPFFNRDADPREPFWFRHDDGKSNRDRRVVECREECTGDVRVGTALVGLFAYFHHPGILKQDEHSLYLPGSVHSKDRFSCASLQLKDGEAFLGAHSSGSAQPNIGTLRYRLK